MQTYGSHIFKRIKIQALFSIPVKRFYLKMVVLIKIFTIYLKELILKICTLRYSSEFLSISTSGAGDKIIALAVLPNLNNQAHGRF